MRDRSMRSAEILPSVDLPIPELLCVIRSALIQGRMLPNRYAYIISKPPTRRLTVCPSSIRYPARP